MRKIISLILILFSVNPLFAQLQSIGNFRIANQFIKFGYPIPEGSTVYNINTGNTYHILKNISLDQSLSSLHYGVDFYENLNLEGTANNSLKLNSYSLANLTASTGQQFGYVGFIKVDGVMEVGKYIDFHIISNDGIDFSPRLEALTTTSLGIDGNEIVTSSNFNSYLLNEKNYIGMRSTASFTDTIGKGVFTKFSHFTVADTTMVSGSISYSNGDIIVGASGNYTITYSFQLSNSETEPVLTFNINNGVTVLASRQVATNSGERQNITIMTTAKLTAGAAISLQYTCSFAISEYLTITDMNIFVKKL